MNNIFRLCMVLFCAVVLSGFSPLKGVKKYRLPNGMMVFLKEDHTQPVVSVQVWVRAGSVNEHEQINGISHFFEHMVFKGTMRYPAGEICRNVEADGGSINAATSAEYTFYHVDIPSNFFDHSVSILSDAMMNCTFPEDEMEKERYVILEEIKRREDDPDTAVWDNLRTELYRSTPYRFSVIGSSAVVRDLNREDLLAFYKTYYRPDNLVFVAVGDFQVGKAKKIIRHYFNAKLKKEPLIGVNLIEPIRSGYTVRISSKQVQQIHFSIGYLGPAFDSRDQYGLDVCAVILGNGRSSRLYRHIREDKQLVWSIGASFFTRTGSGLFSISATCDPEKTNEVVQAIQEELENLRKNPPTDHEMKKAKKILESEWIFDNETYHEQASNLGYFAVMDKLPFMKKYLTNIKEVSVEDVKRVLIKYLKKEHAALSIVHPR